MEVVQNSMMSAQGSSTPPTPPDFLLPNVAAATSYSHSIPLTVNPSLIPSSNHNLNCKPATTLHANESYPQQQLWQPHLHLTANYDRISSETPVHQIVNCPLNVRAPPPPPSPNPAADYLMFNSLDNLNFMQYSSQPPINMQSANNFDHSYSHGFVYSDVFSFNFGQPENLLIKAETDPVRQLPPQYGGGIALHDSGSLYSSILICSSGIQNTAQNEGQIDNQDVTGRQNAGVKELSALEENHDHRQRSMKSTPTGDVTMVKRELDSEDLVFPFEETAAAAASGATRLLNTKEKSSKRRKAQDKRVVFVQAKGGTDKPTGECVPPDSWAWRKYGQKPIKGSPYPRGYYRCSSAKGCTARKQVERSRSDPTMLIITYTSDHNHSNRATRRSMAMASIAKSLQNPSLSSPSSTPSSPIDVLPDQISDMRVTNPEDQTLETSEVPPEMCYNGDLFKKIRMEACEGATAKGGVNIDDFSRSADEGDSSTRPPNCFPVMNFDNGDTRSEEEEIWFQHLPAPSHSVDPFNLFNWSPSGFNPSSSSTW